ncbi:hypothetical protein BKH41_07415 [Helicobacter sp. 12S02232-10]|uniref:lipocalin family protein n=1 Tax=Helicobacter sp. 12S02232-10 TaxID=1476197 RepID=UPI000BA7762C|nr:lipocalin family protein [Helicobacter sp. 12S02232-10]PAF47406.1 hypothetical protein BKH41_07415 [Helicobacter sp. 12S02232-10]
MLELIGMIDLERYGGEWLEMARKPFYFQNKCIASKALYNDIEYKDGKPYKIKVRNSCVTKQGKINVSDGKAKIVGADNRSLSVSFSFFTDWMRKPNYEVLYLDKDYSQAVIGTLNKKYLWILSRKVLDRSAIEKLLEKAKAMGYDTTDIIYDDWEMLKQIKPSFLGI